MFVAADIEDNEVTEEKPKKNHNSSKIITQ